MKKRTKRKLDLERETVRTLTDCALYAAIGGLHDSGNGTCSQDDGCTTAITCYATCTSQATCALGGGR